MNDSEFKLNSKTIGIKIEELFAEDEDTNYIDATVRTAEHFKIELDRMQKYIPKVIKEKIEADARQLNMLKPSKIGKFKPLI